MQFLLSRCRLARPHDRYGRRSENRPARCLCLRPTATLVARRVLHTQVPATPETRSHSSSVTVPEKCCALRHAVGMHRLPWRQREGHSRSADRSPSSAQGYDRRLRVLDFERVGELVSKPRAPLTLRFGQELGRRLDEALGRLSEPIVPVPLPTS